MRYHLNHINQLNFNFHDLKKGVSSPTDIILKLYLHFKFKKELIFNDVVTVLNLDYYPCVTWDRYTEKIYKSSNVLSIYKNAKATNRLKYLDILRLNIEDSYKVEYLKLCSFLPPYSLEKFIPVKEVSRALVLYELVKPVDSGIILTLER